MATKAQVDSVYQKYGIAPNRVWLEADRCRRSLVFGVARFQRFFEWCEFSDTDEQQSRQIGNAVLPMFSCKLVHSIIRHLKQNDGWSEMYTVQTDIAKRVVDAAIKVSSLAVLSKRFYMNRRGICLI